jgi:hypothetical protein
VAPATIIPDVAPGGEQKVTVEQNWLTLFMAASCHIGKSPGAGIAVMIDK